MAGVLSPRLTLFLRDINRQFGKQRRVVRFLDGLPLSLAVEPVLVRRPELHFGSDKGNNFKGECGRRKAEGGRRRAEGGGTRLAPAGSSREVESLSAFLGRVRFVNHLVDAAQ